MKKVLCLCFIIMFSFTFVGCSIKQTNTMNEESLSDYDKIIINLLIDWKSFKEYSYEEELSDFKINQLFYTINAEDELNVAVDWNYRTGDQTITEKVVILTGDDKNEVNKLYARQIYNNYKNVRDSIRILYDNVLEVKEKNLFEDDVVVEDIVDDKINLFEDKMNQELTQEELTEKNQKWDYVLNLPEELEENSVDNYVEYKVESGMTVMDVAELYRMDVISIIQNNSNYNLTDKSTPLSEGMILKIPTSISEDNASNETKKYYKEYKLTGTTDDRIATITFSKNNHCDIDFSKLSRTVNLGSSYSRDYMYITYNDGNCTYETSDEKNFTVKYQGTFNVVHQGVYINHNAYVMQTDNQEMMITFNDDYSTFQITNGQFKMANYAVYLEGSAVGAKIQFNKTYSTNSGSAWLIFNEDGTGTFKYEAGVNGKITDQKISVTYSVNGNNLTVNGTAEGNSLDCIIQEDDLLSCSPQDRPGLYSNYSIKN